MRASKFTNKIHTEIESNDNKEKIKKEKIPKDQTHPIDFTEIEELKDYSSATCKIKFKFLKEGKVAIAYGTGFFCKIDDKNIPFNKALFTNNHVLNKNEIEINNQIELQYCGETIKIEITKERKAFTNKKLDYTCIEILESDNIKKFFYIDEAIFNNKNSLINKEIFALQYPKGNFRFHIGKILNINNNRIEHNIPTDEGSSGSPLIRRHNIILIVGIHFGAQEIEIEKSEQKKDESNVEFKCNVAIPFDFIIKNIIDKINKSPKNNKIKSIE